jgi:hypothetical protein
MKQNKKFKRGNIMKQEVAEYLVDACQFNGIDAEIREDYSGRGMFGKTTHGVVVNDSSMSSVLSAVINYGNDDGIEVNGFDTDSMGMGFIIY